MDFTNILILIALAIFIFLAIRELICWYYKINKQIKIQQSILETMLKIYEQNGGKVNWDAVKDLIEK
jgi:hypothetical protein